MKSIYELTRPEGLEVRARLRHALETLDALYRADHSTDASPVETVKGYVSEVGMETATELIGTLVESSRKDGRISRRCVEWAESQPTTWDSASSDRCALYTTIHKSHLDQLCEALIDLQTAETEAESEPETTAETTAETQEPSKPQQTRRAYFVNYWRDFGNTYRLLYAETSADFTALPEGAERITRKEALRLAKEEAERCRIDPNFSGYADTAIFPAADPDGMWLHPSRYTLRARIWERKQKI